MKRPVAIGMILLGVSILVLFFLNLLLGSVSIPAGQVWKALWGGEMDNAIWQNIILKSRFPQALTALVAGAGLSVAGLQMQTVFRNPLAGPSVLGVSSGASLGVAFVVLLSGRIGGVALSRLGYMGEFAMTVSAIIGAMAIMLLNNLLIYLFSPQHGVEIYGTCHELVHIAGRYNITSEQLLYQLNVVLKYLATIPIVLLFVTTTDPSEFASSLNRIGVNYKIAYSVALALRYIPDIQREYHDITLSLQARGIEMNGRKAAPRMRPAPWMIMRFLGSLAAHLSLSVPASSTPAKAAT